MTTFDRLSGLRRVRAGLALCTLALSAACTTPLVTELHTLMPLQSSTVALDAQLWLAPLSLPAQVDQPQWLVRLEDGSLRLLEQQRWAAGLRDEFHAALSDALGAGGRSDAAWRVQVHITRFELRRAHQTRLEARWSLRESKGNPVALDCLAVHHRDVGPGMAALAEGQRQALQALAAQIRGHLRAAREGQRLAC